MTRSLHSKTAWFRRRSPCGVPRDLPPYLMRDIGLDPWPEHPRLPFHTLW